MKMSLATRLDRHFRSAAALATAAALSAGVGTADASIVYVGSANINIPSTFAGVYLNVVTGVNNAVPGNVPGWDVGPWSATALNMFAPTVAPGNAGGHVGGTTTYFNLAAGTPISAASTFSGPGTATMDAGAPLNFNSSNNLVGFRFYNETTSQVHYGWMRLAVSGTQQAQPRTIVEYAYEDTPETEIAAGATISNPNFGSCCLPNGVCSTILAADCTAQGGFAGAVGSNCGAANCATRCCLSDSTCQMLSPTACASAGGVSAVGADCSAACPATGACCRNDGTCSLLPQTSCVNAGSIARSYNGDGTTCASAECGKFKVVSDVAGTFTDITSTGTAFPNPPATGSLDDGTYLFTSSVTNQLVDNANLIVSTNGNISTVQAFTNFTNTVIPNTAAGPLALYAMWDDLDNNTPSQILHHATTENGVAVEIIQWNTFHHATTNGNGVVQLKIFAPGGPALVQYLYQDLTWNWNGNSATIGVQWATNRAFQYSFGTTNAAGGPIANNAVLSVVGAGTAPACYANCDSSTALPFLNVLDFTCFLQKFAAASPYANCDSSTAAPALNVLDFTCFLQKFAAGCSAP